MNYLIIIKHKYLPIIQNWAEEHGLLRPPVLFCKSCMYFGPDTDMCIRTIIDDSGNKVQRNVRIVSKKDDFPTIACKNFVAKPKREYYKHN